MKRFGQGELQHMDVSALSRVMHTLCKVLVNEGSSLLYNRTLSRVLCIREYKYCTCIGTYVHSPPLLV